MGLGDGFDAGAAGYGGGGGAGGGSINVSAGTSSQNLTALTFGNAGGVSFGLDPVASVITANVTAAPSPVNVSAGTTSNNLGSIVFSNSNGISFGLNGSTITGTVATNYLTTAMQSNAATISNINVSAGTTSNNLSAITFSNANGLSFGLNASTITGSYTVPTVTNSSMTVSDAATSGTLARLAFTNLHGITLSLSTGAGGSHTIVGSYTVPTVTNSSWTVSDAATSGTVAQLAFTNLNGMTLSLSTGAGGSHTIVGSYTVPSQSNQSAIKGLGASNTGNTAGNTGLSTGIDWVLAGSNGVTISESTHAGGPNTLWVSGTTYPAQSSQSAIGGLGASNTGNTAGNTGISTGIDWVLAGSNNITISESTTAGGPNTLWVSGAAAGGAQTAISGIGVSNTTYTSGTVIFSAQANITLNSSTNGASQYVQFSVAAQSNQSAIKGLGASNTGNTAGNTGLSTGIDWVIAGSNGVTISESTAGGGPNTLWVSGTTYPAQSNQSAIRGLGASNTGNTAGNTGISTGIDWVIAGTNNITISESTAGGGPNTLWVSAFNQSNQTVGFYAVGNTASTSTSTTLDARTISFDGLGAVSVGFSNGSIQLSAPPVSQLTGSSPVSLSSAGSTITISLIPVVEWAPDNNGNLATNSTIGQSSLFVYPFDIGFPLSASRLNVFMSIGTTSSQVASSGSGSLGVGYAIYTRGTGASTERISQLTSYSAVVISYTSSSGTQFAATHYIGLSNATSHSTSQKALSTSNASTYPATSLGGFRVVALPLNLSMTPGRYWIGLSQQTTNNASASFDIDASFLQSTMSNFIAYRAFGAASAASNASEWGVSAGMGTYSAQSAAWPGSMGLSNSDIRLPLSMTFPYFNISGISTNTNIL